MWITSSKLACDHGQCVRVSVGARRVGVGDSTSDPAGQVPVLAVERADWQTFLGEVRAGEWDR